MIRRRERQPARQPVEPLAPRPRDAELSADGREQVEWEKDQLVRLVAWHLEATGAPASLDPRLLEWQTRELREEAEEKRTQIDMQKRDAVVRRIRAKLLAGRLGVACAPGHPDRVDAPQGQTAAEGLARSAGARCAVRFDQAVAAGTGRELWDEPCDGWVRLPDEIPDGRHVALEVAGDSMEPLLHDGDVVLVRVGAELARDTVVVARHPEDGYVVKRVSKAGSRWVELASLNDAYPPVRIPRREALVVGTVLMRWCAHAPE